MGSEFVVKRKNCDCGSSCAHELADECYRDQCRCCLSDHQGPFGKNR